MSTDEERKQSRFSKRVEIPTTPQSATSPSLTPSSLSLASEELSSSTMNSLEISSNDTVTKFHKELLSDLRDRYEPMNLDDYFFSEDPSEIDSEELEHESDEDLLKMERRLDEILPLSDLWSDSFFLLNDSEEFEDEDRLKQKEDSTEPEKDGKEMSRKEKEKGSGKMKEDDESDATVSNRDEAKFRGPGEDLYEFEMEHEERLSSGESSDVELDSISDDPEWNAYVKMCLNEEKYKKKKMSADRLLSMSERSSASKVFFDAEDLSIGTEWDVNKALIESLTQEFLSDLVNTVVSACETYNERAFLENQLDKPRIFKEIKFKRHEMLEGKTILNMLNRAIIDYYRIKGVKRVFITEEDDESRVFQNLYNQNMSRLDHLLERKHRLQKFLPELYNTLNLEAYDLLEADKQLKEDLQHTMGNALKVKKRPFLEKVLNDFFEKMEKRLTEHSQLRKIMIKKLHTFLILRERLRDMKNIDGSNIDAYLEMKYDVQVLERTVKEKKESMEKRIYEHHTNLHVLAHLEDYLNTLILKTDLLRKVYASFKGKPEILREELHKLKIIQTRNNKFKLHILQDRIFFEKRIMQVFQHDGEKIKLAKVNLVSLRKELAKLERVYNKLSQKYMKISKKLK